MENKKLYEMAYFKGYAEIWKVIRIFFKTQLGSHTHSFTTIDFTTFHERANQNLHQNYTKFKSIAKLKMAYLRQKVGG